MRTLDKGMRSPQTIDGTGLGGKLSFTHDHRRLPVGVDPHDVAATWNGEFERTEGEEPSASAFPPDDATILRQMRAWARFRSRSQPVQISTPSPSYCVKPNRPPAAMQRNAKARASGVGCFQTDWLMPMFRP
jgi:hypothetical protein